jgi:diphosphomevalonate decarboxylase
MNRQTLIKQLLLGKNKVPVKDKAGAYAPTNIALVKYWGKRDKELNLPMTGSLSISLADKGAHTHISLSQTALDEVFINGERASADAKFVKRLVAFMDLLRPNPQTRYQVDTHVNIPIAAGLASSACGFAALVKAFDQFYGWQLPNEILSILARIGSGSASRSIYDGFVEWHQGDRADGLDSFAERLPYEWPELRIGLLIFSTAQKSLGSTEAMQRTVQTSKLYTAWPKQVAEDLSHMGAALATRDFDLLGQTAEHNALTMHATMLSSWPPISYANIETTAAMHKIWQLRAEGMPLYFTQDAGPNLKLLFLAKDEAIVRQQFANIEVVHPFAGELAHCYANTKASSALETATLESDLKAMQDKSRR